jgi:chromosome partitioning protein
MKAVALLARKGGTGKTTCCVHMGVLAEASGQRVIFFDLDPQGSLSAWWQTRPAETPALVQTDARRLPDLLNAAASEGYDLAVVDTPPAVTFDAARVAQAVDLALIPLRPSILDIYAVSGTADVVVATKTPAMLVLNACPAPRGVGEASVTMEARRALGSMSVPIAETAIGQRTDYTRALNDGAAVNEFAPESKAAAEMTRLWGEVHRSLP